uniref:Uncharacterized protein n=1 Tax=Ixodes ricinus TaxID=34613 RepID=A0A6B0UQX6_IXORI
MPSSAPDSLVAASLPLLTVAFSAGAFGFTFFLPLAAAATTFFTVVLGLAGVEATFGVVTAASGLPSFRAAAAALAARALAWLFLASDLLRAPPGSYLVLSTEIILPCSSVRSRCWMHFVPSSMAPMVMKP